RKCRRCGSPSASENYHADRDHAVVVALVQVTVVAIEVAVLRTRPSVAPYGRPLPGKVLCVTAADGDGDTNWSTLSTTATVTRTGCSPDYSTARKLALPVSVGTGL